jgi:hypothetical protein
MPTRFAALVDERGCRPRRLAGATMNARSSMYSHEAGEAAHATARAGDVNEKVVLVQRPPCR